MIELPVYCINAWSWLCHKPALGYQHPCIRKHSPSARYPALDLWGHAGCRFWPGLPSLTGKQHFPLIKPPVKHPMSPEPCGGLRELQLNGHLCILGTDAVPELHTQGYHCRICCSWLQPMSARSLCKSVIERKILFQSSEWNSCCGKRERQANSYSTVIFMCTYMHVHTSIVLWQVGQCECCPSAGNSDINIKTWMQKGKWNLQPIPHTLENTLVQVNWNNCFYILFLLLLL